MAIRISGLATFAAGAAAGAVAVATYPKWKDKVTPLVGAALAGAADAARQAAEAASQAAANVTDVTPDAPQGPTIFRADAPATPAATVA